MLSDHIDHLFGGHHNRFTGLDPGINFLKTFLDMCVTHITFCIAVLVIGPAACKQRPDSLQYFLYQSFTA
jgi:hypothetical protein